MPASPVPKTPQIDEIVETFSFLDDWEERYKYLIDLGRVLEPLAPEEKTESNRVRGCVSQVWLSVQAIADNDGTIRLFFKGDSDAFIVRGLVALTLALFQGQTAQAILSTDAQAAFAALGLQDHLTPQRANGLRAMVERIQNAAREVQSGASAATAQSPAA